MSQKEFKMKTILTTLSILSLTFAAADVAKNASFTVEKSSNQNELHIKLEANADVLGIQFDVNYDPAQISLSETDIAHMFGNADSRANMSVYSKIKEPGLARVIMFDLGGQPILNANNLENVVRLTYSVENDSKSANVKVSNIVLAGYHGEEVSLESDELDITFDLNDSVQPFETTIVGNFPNPFNPTTKIEFNLKNAGQVDVTVYDLQGRKVASLYSGLLEAKEGHVFSWDASNVASGQYFARITAPGFSDVLNMTLIK